MKVTWYDVPVKNTTNRQTFQLVLYPSGVIRLVYVTLQTPAASTVGVEDGNGEYGTIYTGTLYNDAVLEVKNKASGDSHYLAHNVPGYLSNPTPESRTGEGIITAVNAAPPSYGAIAHPYAVNYPWVYWTKASNGSTQVAVRGFRGLELLSIQAQASTSTLSKWDNLLNTDLQTTIANNGGFVVGFSGSDMHSIYQSSWGRCVDYVYSSTQTMAAVQTAAAAGKVVASSDGSATSFEAYYGSTAYPLGSVLNVASGGTVTLRGKAAISSGSTLSKLRLIRSGVYVGDITVNADGTWSTTVTTTSDCYYRVELVTTIGSTYYYTYANPIFLNVP